MRKGWIWLPVGLVVVGAGGAVALRATRSGSAAAATATSYALGTVVRGSFHETVTGSGAVTAGATADVYASESGTVETVLASEGQTVSKGEVLATVGDQGSLAATLANAQSQLKEDKASLQELLHPDPTAAELSAAQAQVAEAEAKLAEDEATAQAASAVTAPISGVVITVDTQNGSTVQSGQDLLEIGSAGSYVVDASIDQAEIANIYQGEGAEVTGNGLDAVLPAVISSIGLASSGSSRLGTDYPLVLAIENTSGLTSLRAGEEVEVSIPGSYLSVSGTIAYAQTAEVTAPAAGTAAELDEAAGDSVQQGESLLSITSPSEAVQVIADKASLFSAQSSLESLTVGDAPTSTAVLQAEAKVVSDEQAIAQDQSAVAGLMLRSPIAGKVTAVNLAVGDTVTSGGSAAFAIEDVSQMGVEVSVDERAVAKLHVGEKASITSSAFSGTTFTGTLASIAPVGTDSQGVSTFTVDILLDHSRGLLPGMAASVTIEVSGVQDALLVPAEAVSGSGKNATVKQLVGGKEVTRKIVAGLSNGVFTQVLSGLSLGERVVTATAVTTTVQRPKASTSRKSPTGGLPPNGGTPPTGGAPGASTGGQ